MKKVTRPIIYTREFVFKELQSMLELLKKDKKIVFIGGLFLMKTYSIQRFSEWSEKFKEDKEISEAIGQIEDILENRIVSGAIHKKYESKMSMFVLKNKHGWKDKSEVDNNVKGSIIYLPPKKNQ